MKYRKGKLNNEISPLTIPEIDFIMEEMNKGKESESVKQHVQPNVRIHEKINGASEQIKNLFEDIRKEENIQLETVEGIKAEIVPIIEEAAKNPDIYYLFEEMQAKNEYTYKHNIGVGIIATYLGTKLGLSKESLSNLTLAAILHDVGKTRIPERLLEKPGKLTAKEYDEIKRHTIYGYELLKSIPGIPPSIALTALQHHEREDGQGYPHKLKGSNIYYLSKIVAIADVFHAMSSDRVYHQAMPFYKVIEQMNRDVFGKFNPKMLLVFINQLMGTLVGKEVMLTNQQIGTIIMINPYEPLKVLMKTNSGILDLRLEKELQIERIIGK
ncbi:HD-GYP domain-containing protein [Peribacillus sp. TH16]|uniref:HD-GYP domain-containing protein n=1 Tax=Peribacillus sp. TH16 TaxID=2798482 RepID=UPI001912F0E6|nr:HD-GYP domain-containing protein [Peribacillus sp. TH16]MBK5483694.1 HD-GYP domain-containing protein [Peribacillus sp. TH16]